MKNLMVKILALAIMLPLVNACKVSSKVTAWQIPADEYVFIEYYQTNDGRALEGKPFPGRRIDGPTYAFNPETGELNSYAGVEYNTDSLRVMLGRGLVLRGTQGGGLHSRLIPHSTLSFEEGKLRVEGISPEGVNVVWDNQPILLKVGEPWENRTVEVDTLSSPDGRVIVENTTTYTMVFHGFLKKEKLSNN